MAVEEPASAYSCFDVVVAVIYMALLRHHVWLSSSFD